MENINEDFNWVLKVLDSCETLTQVRRTEKLFDNFKNLHKEQFKSLGKKDQTKELEDLKKASFYLNRKIENIKKDGVTNK